MKKILLVTTVLVGGMAFSQAGVNISIGFGIPLPPLPAVVIRQPAPFCPAPVYVAPPICLPRVMVPCAPALYRPAYACRDPHARHANWNRHGHGHRR